MFFFSLSCTLHAFQIWIPVCSQEFNWSLPQGWQHWPVWWAGFALKRGHVHNHLSSDCFLSLLENETNFCKNVISPSQGFLLFQIRLLTKAGAALLITMSLGCLLQQHMRSYWRPLEMKEFKVCLWSNAALQYRTYLSMIPQHLLSSWTGGRLSSHPIWLSSELLLSPDLTPCLWAPSSWQ